MKMCKSEIISETSRLLLSTWEQDFTGEFHYLAQDLEVMRYIGNGKPWSNEKTVSFVNKQIALQNSLGFCLWRLQCRKTNEFIGFCGLQPLSGTDDIEIGWWLKKSWWKLGLATEAAREVLSLGFTKHNLNQIVAIVQKPNSASLNIVEKLGMKPAGVYPHHTLDVEVFLYTIAGINNTLYRGR